MTKKIIIVASINPVKINAAYGGFRKMFPKQKFTVEGVAVSSGVGDQPMNETDTLKGATNRVLLARKAKPNANYWVGLEGGVEEIGKEMRTVIWAVVYSKKQRGKAKGASIILPAEMRRLIKSGLEMGLADDKIFGRVNSKQKAGTFGLLTKNATNRTEVYEEAIILALIPFINPRLYPKIGKIA